MLSCSSVRYTIYTSSISHFLWSVDLQIFDKILYKGKINAKLCECPMYTGKPLLWSARPAMGSQRETKTVRLWANSQFKPRNMRVHNKVIYSEPIDQSPIPAVTSTDSRTGTWCTLVIKLAWVWDSGGALVVKPIVHRVARHLTQCSTWS